MSNIKTKIYLAGKISGLPEDEVSEKFNSADALYSEQGFHVLNRNWGTADANGVVNHIK